jgi:hypothetical protein
MQLYSCVLVAARVLFLVSDLLCELSDLLGYGLETLLECYVLGRDAFAYGLVDGVRLVEELVSFL